jgi:hypothetical protein
VLSIALIFYKTQKVDAARSAASTFWVLCSDILGDRYIKNQKIEGGAPRRLLFSGFGS